MKVMKPNIVLIVTDTLRKDYSSKLDKLLEVGFNKIDNAFTPSSWTLPSHVSMFTGLYPYFHGVHEYYGVNDMVDDYAKLSKLAMGKFENLISILKDENYETIGISANAFITPIFGFNFHSNYLVTFPPLAIIDDKLINLLDKYYTRYKSKIKLLSDLIKERKLDEVNLIIKYKLSNNSLRDYLYYRSKILHKGCNLILKKLHQIKFDDRFFLFINVMEAHEPYSNEVIGKGIYDKYDYNFLRSIFFGSAENSIIAHYRQYYGLHADNAVNCVLNIISELSKKVNIDDTLIIVTSDHGNHIGEYGRVYHGFYLSDELLRVPFYIRYPKTVNPKIEIEKNTISLTSIYSIIKSIVYDEKLIINNKFVISESYGPQHSLKTIKSYFKLTDSEIRNYYTHKVRISYTDKHLIYDLDKDQVVEASQYFDLDCIQKIKELFS
ncbi:sulfatase-like hydrolase/transferase [Saccharolobus islandicus]|nr:sulfatase-like hydrolase/transferase [Sulfolobus islandicus]